MNRSEIRNGRKETRCFVIIKAARNTVWEQFKNDYREGKQMETLRPHVKGRSWYYFSAASFQKPTLSITVTNAVVIIVYREVLLSRSTGNQRES